jgi:23S rRNA (adenine-N6)-dimethyltransferase
VSHRDNGLYSQNRIVNRKLLQKLVEQSDIREEDTVFDIGAGEGIISRALLDEGARVIAVEKDAEIYRKCRAKFLTEDRFELYLDDFLIMDFPPEGLYKVFSNIPFIHTAAIIDKLLFCDNPPEDCYLVIQKEAAERYAGIGGETLQSLLVKPIFWVDIIYYFSRKDFFPVPSVDIVLAQFENRRCRLVSEKDYGSYRDFILFCRERADKPVKRVLTELFTWGQFRRLSQLLDINYRMNTESLTFMQYLAIFQFLLKSR